MLNQIEKVICFVGPTGVGKTTTLKVAAKLKITDSASVELISMDTYHSSK